jgi:hypothetical protein
MHSHPNARLTPISRERLIGRHLNEGEPLNALAAQAGISLRSAYKWLAAHHHRGGLLTAANDHEHPFVTAGLDWQHSCERE